ncbi:hypothetical protein WA026_019249, partial [Henosepilachna vigintioctopunctata]
MKNLERTNKEILTSLENVLSPHTLREFKRTQQILYNKEFHSVKQTNIDKLNRLELASRQNVENQEKWLKNISSTQIPEDVEVFSSFGSKFSIPQPVKQISIDHLITDIEDMIQKTPESTRDLYRTKIS